jgi:hypothetical protein
VQFDVTFTSTSGAQPVVVDCTTPTPAILNAAPGHAIFNPAALSCSFVPVELQGFTVE